MNIRNELAKLRQRANSAASEDVVRAISDLMDELAAEAAGGGETRTTDTLSAVFDEEQERDDRSHS